MAWALYALTFIKCLHLPHYFMFHPPHYEYVRGLPILDENVVRADYGDCSRLD